MNSLTFAKELLEKANAATPGPWWQNGLDVESSHLTVGEGEEFTELYDTETGRSTGKRIKRHATEGPFTKKALGIDANAILLFTSSSILGDRPYEEASATADFIAAANPENIKALCNAIIKLGIALEEIDRICTRFLLVECCCDSRDVDDGYDSCIYCRVGNQISEIARAALAEIKRDGK